MIKFFGTTIYIYPRGQKGGRDGTDLLCWMLTLCLHRQPRPTDGLVILLIRLALTIALTSILILLLHHLSPQRHGPLCIVSGLLLPHLHLLIY